MADAEERQTKLEQLERLKQLGEQAYDGMYDACTFRDSDNAYRDAKDSFYDAIGLARELGLAEEVEALSRRLEHIKDVYHSQFSH
jgi:hypothetical protein